MVNVTDISYVRLRAPDLDKMEAFLSDFGMKRAHRTDTRLYMHGTGSDRYLHVTELGEPDFVGFAFNAGSLEDLEGLARMEDSSDIEEIDAPGGGYRVVMTDPDGIQVEIVYGIEPRPPATAANRAPLNIRSTYQRQGEFVRYEKAPSNVRRLGHVVIFVSDFPQSRDWYQPRFGFLISDDIVADDQPDKPVSAFFRCNKGDEFVDHHTLLTVERPGMAGLNHCAFEVEDFDDLQLGHDYLVDNDHQHFWGIGRHVQGSQIFDYWQDPWGRTHEHWTDGDQLNANSPRGRTAAAHVLDVQWGQRHPMNR